MKTINAENYKKRLIEMLGEFDRICRDNNIKYSLICGSLIGAVRHNGIIPWDDDVDVAFSYEEYEKFLKLIKKKSVYGKYTFMTNSNNSSYFYPFVKMVDTDTLVVEDRVKEIDDYGLFIDIFYYNNVPKGSFFQKKYWYETMFGISLISGYAITHFKKNEKHKIAKVIGKIVSKIIGLKRCVHFYEKHISKYNKKDTGLVMLNWPAYGLEHEIQNKKDILEYKDIDFDGINAMIFSEYDSILTTTYGEYMKLPPEKDRINHSMLVYKK